jgi:hypothetical protein
LRKTELPGKWERLQEWCEDASQLDAGRQYRALFVREEDWERYKPKGFHDAVAAFAAIPPLNRSQIRSILKSERL